MPRLVLEIGTEELPPRFFPPALGQLKQGMESLLGRLRLSHGEVRVWGTPRRLVAIVDDVAAQQAAATREGAWPGRQGWPSRTVSRRKPRRGLRSAMA